MSLAAGWHNEQMDKGGFPYVGHLMGVWNRVRLESETVQVVALLHDILEDTNCPEAEIAAFGEKILYAVQALTHHKWERYEDYIARVKKNEIARIVKLADLADNTLEFRLRHLREGDKIYFGNRKKTHYLPAIEELMKGNQ